MAEAKVDEEVSVRFVSHEDRARAAFRFIAAARYAPQWSQSGEGDAESLEDSPSAG